MAVVAEYRFEDLKARVIIHDDFLLPEDKRQELAEHLFAYEQAAFERKWLEEHRDELG